MGLTRTEKTVSSKIQKRYDGRVHKNWCSDFTTNFNNYKSVINFKVNSLLS